MDNRIRGLTRNAVVLSLCLTGIGTNVRAELLVSASVGGAPTGATYVNFDNVEFPLGNAGGTSNGVTVSFISGDGKAVQGSQDGANNAPHLSNGNGTLFGDPTNGLDTTIYITTGNGSVELTMPGQETYLGILWGSVDNDNTLSFYNGTTLIGTVTGADIADSTVGHRVVNGTYYVNISSTESFNRVVASSTNHAFEFDNVSYNPASVPEPSSLMIVSLGGLIMASLGRLMMTSVGGLMMVSICGLILASLGGLILASHGGYAFMATRMRRHKV